MTIATKSGGLFRAAALTFLLAASPVSAQQAPAGGAGSAPSGSGVALAVQPPTEAHVRLARELMQHIGAEKLIVSLVPGMSSTLITTVTRTRPELLKDLKEVVATIVKDYEAQQAQVMDSATSIFVRAMTEQELRETVTFLRTPAGQKFLDTQGTSVRQVSDMLEGWSRQMSQEMFERARTEMKKKGHDY